MFRGRDPQHSRRIRRHGATIDPLSQLKPSVATPSLPLQLLTKRPPFGFLLCNPCISHPSMLLYASAVPPPTQYLMGDQTWAPSVRQMSANDAGPYSTPLDAGTSLLCCSLYIPQHRCLLVLHVRRGLLRSSHDPFQDQHEVVLPNLT